MQADTINWARRVGLSLVAVVVFCALSSGPARGSGYHPPFDQAVEEAPWILLHTVISGHVPKDVLKNLPPEARGRVYLVKVKQVFRGPFKPGDRLLVWDPWYRSTAGYFLNEKGDNLSFLAPPGAERKYRIPGRGRAKAAPEVRSHKTYGGGTAAKDAKLKVGLVFRNKSDTVSKGRGHGMKDWMRLLTLTKVGSRPIDLKQARAAMVKTSGRELVHYVLTHWPGALSKKDAALVRRMINARPGDAMVTASAVKLLRSNKMPLAAAVLKRLLATGSRYARYELLKDVTKANVKAVRDVLWSWIEKDQEGVLEAIERLAALQPAYLETRLKAARLPFWLNIPALAALSKTPQDLGQKPYPAGAMKANKYDLFELGKLVKGQTFGVWHAVSWTRSDGLAPYMPLLVPHFPKMKPEAQEVAVAAMRSWGFEVKRAGTTIVIGRRTKPPLVIALEPIPGQPRKVRLKETALRPLLLCPKGGGRQVRITMKGGQETSLETSQGSFSDKHPKECFKSRTGVVRDEVVDLTSLLGNLKKPGLYQVRVALTHMFAGREHGLDAWTGMVLSAPLDLRLPITAAANKTVAAPATKPKAPASKPAAAATPKKSKSGGCACAAPGSKGHGLPLVIVLVFLLVAVRSRN
ncbi:MAG: hypothetical protein ABI333_04920 [bacterium]